MKYVQFTEEEKVRANETDLLEYLQSRGEKVKKVGKQYVLEDKNALCVYGFKWYDHYEKVGGNAVTFMKYYYGMEYSDAVVELLGKNNIQSLKGDSLYTKSKQVQNKNNTKSYEKENKVSKPFSLPLKNRSNERLYNYLQNKRFIDNEILNYFVLKGKIYQEEKYNNIIFVGTDEESNAKFACAKGSYESKKGAFKQTVTGSDCNYSFNYLGKNEKLYVFESPIDMLSYISLNKENWQESSYISLDGTALKPLQYFLDQNNTVKEINLCLDYDIAGIENTDKIKDNLKESYKNINIISPKNKDWNEDLKELNGITPKLPQNHPKKEAYKQLVSMLLFSLEERKNMFDLDVDCIRLMYDIFLETFNDKKYNDSLSVVTEMQLPLLGNIQKQFKSLGRDVSYKDIINYSENNYKVYEDKGKLKAKDGEMKSLIKKALELGGKSVLTESEKKKHTNNLIKILELSFKIGVDVFAKNDKEQIESQNSKFVQTM